MSHPQSNIFAWSYHHAGMPPGTTGLLDTRDQNHDQWSAPAMGNQSGIYHLYAVLHIIIPTLRGIITQNQNLLIIFSVIDGIAIQNTHTVRLTIADECLVAGWSMFSTTKTSNFQYFSKFHNSSSSRSFEEKCWMNHQMKTRCFVELGLR